MKKTIIGIILLLTLIGCSNIRMKDAYITHFEDQNSATRVIEDKHKVPNELLAQFPPDFRLAHYLGLLTVVIDGDGKLYFGPGMTSNFAYISNSSEFQEIKDKYSSDEYRTASPKGFPHVLGIIPNIDISSALELEAGQDWLRFFHRYYEKLEDKRNSKKVLEKILMDIENAETTKQNINSEIHSVIKQIEVEKSQINKLIKEIAQIQIPGFTETILLLPGLKVPYSYDDDIFRTVYESKLINIKDRLRTNGVSNPHLKEETIEALELANQMIGNPRGHFVPHIADMIESANLTPITLASASRSILQQASLSSSTKAKYLNSKHAFGVAVDISFIGANYNVRVKDPTTDNMQNYNLLMMVLNQAGFVRSTTFSNMKERNHYSISKYSQFSNGLFNREYDQGAFVDLALSFFKEFEAAGDREYLNLIATLKSLSLQQQREITRYHSVREDIKKVQAHLAEEKKKLASEKLKRAQKEREKQKKLEEKARKEESLRRQREQERAQQRERELHDARIERMERQRERREAERQHRERIEREGQQMREWMRDIERRDRERQRREPPERDWDRDLA